MRAPHPVILRYRAHINVTALALTALGFMAVWDPRLRDAGAAAILGTVLAWLVLRNRVRPTAADYVEYLEARAEEEGYGAWLYRANQDFKELWGIGGLEEVGEP
jgi:hypothetical protein